MGICGCQMEGRQNLRPGTKISPGLVFNDHDKTIVRAYRYFFNV